MADDLGSASVVITPDMARFAADLRAGLAATDAGKVDVGLNVNEAKLDEFKAQVSAYNAVIGVGIRVDDAQLKAVQAELDAFGLEHKTATATVDTHGAKQELDDVKTSADGAGNSLNKLGKSASDAGSNMGGLVTAILTLGPALVPIATVATGAAIGIGGAFAAAAAGLGAFALAAKGDLPQVTAEVNKVVTSFQQLTAPQVMPAVQGAVSLLKPVLDALIPTVKNVSLALDALEGSARQALGGDTFRNFVSFIQANAGPAILAFGHLFAGLGTAIADALEASQPLITQMDSALTGLGTDLSKWGAGLATGGGFNAFISAVQTEGPLVLQILKDLAGIFVSLTAGANNLGIGLLTVLNPMLEFVNVILKLGGPNMAAITLGIIGLATAFNKFGPSVKGAIESLGEFSAKVALVSSGEAVGGLSGALAGIVSAMGGVGIAAGAVGIALAVGIGTFALWRAGSASLHAETEKLTGGLENLSTTGLAQAQRAFSETTAQIKVLQPELDAATEKMEHAGGAGLIVARQVGELDNAIGELKTKQEAAKTAMDNFNKGTDEIAAKLGITKTQADEVAQAFGYTLTNALTKVQLKDISTKFNQAATSVGLTTTELGKLIDVTGQTTQTITKDMPAQAAAIGLTTQALAELEIQSGKTGATFKTAVTNAEQATSSSFASFASIVQNFAGSTLPIAGSAIADFFTQHVAEAQQFGANIMQAMKDGYDPTLINQILEAGPQQAGGLLAGLVLNYSDSLKAEVNAGVASLTQLQQAQVEQSRLIALATTANTAQMTQDLGTAMAIDQEKAVEGAGATVTSVAQALKLGEPQVQQVSDEFGLMLPTSLQQQQVAAYLAALAQAQQAEAGLAAGQANAKVTSQQFAALLTNQIQTEAPNTFAAALNQGGQYPAGIGVSVADAKVIAGVAAGDVSTALGEPSKPKAAGINTGAQWAQGMGSQTPAATAAASGLVTAAENELNAHQDRARGFGTATANAFVQGISAHAGIAAAAADAFTIAAIAPFNAHQNLAGVYASNEVDGFIRGLQGHLGAAVAATDAFTIAALGPFNAHQNLAANYGSNEANAFVRGMTSVGTGGVDGFVIGAIAPMNAHQDRARQYGANTAGAFAQGIAGEAGAAAAAAASVAAAAIAALAAVPKIASPSKVTLALGHEFGQGFVIGVSGSIPNAVTSSTMLATQAVVAMENQLKVLESFKKQAQATLSGDVLAARLANINELEFQAQSQLTRSATYAAPSPIPTPIRPTGGAAVTDIPQTEASAGLNYAPTYHVTISGTTEEQAQQLQAMLAYHDAQLLAELTAVGAR